MKYSLEVEAASPVSTIASTIATLAPPPPPPKSVPPMAAKGLLPPVTLLPLSTSDDDVPVVVAAKCPFDAEEHLTQLWSTFWTKGVTA